MEDPIRRDIRVIQKQLELIVGRIDYLTEVLADEATYGFISLEHSNELVLLATWKTLAVAVKNVRWEEGEEEEGD